MRDAISANLSKNKGRGILDNDYEAAFDYMVMLWIFDVMRAKGCNEKVIERLRNIYKDSITVVVVNNIPGKAFKNKRWSIRTLYVTIGLF